MQMLAVILKFGDDPEYQLANGLTLHLVTCKADPRNPPHAASPATANCNAMLGAAMLIRAVPPS